MNFFPVWRGKCGVSDATSTPPVTPLVCNAEAIVKFAAVFPGDPIAAPSLHLGGCRGNPALHLGGSRGPCSPMGLLWTQISPSIASRGFQGATLSQGVLIHSSSIFLPN